MNVDLYGPPPTDDPENSEGGGFSAGENVQPALYGPPPEDIDPDKSDGSSENGDDGFDSSENVQPALYGPPPVFEGQDPDPVEEPDTEDYPQGSEPVSGLDDSEGVYDSEGTDPIAEGDSDPQYPETARDATTPNEMASSTQYETVSPDTGQHY